MKSKVGKFNITKFDNTSHYFQKLKNKLYKNVFLQHINNFPAYDFLCGGGICSQR